MVAGDDDLLGFSDEVAGETLPAGGPAWRILVTDDDATVHETTSIALKGERIAGRSLELLHATSAREARRMVAADASIHLVLLDVVMETEDAGLLLVHVMRKELGRDRLRIVIRTGQAGYAPEHAVRSNYDIDGYVVKAQLTRDKLVELLETLLASERPARAG